MDMAMAEPVRIEDDDGCRENERHGEWHFADMLCRSFTKVSRVVLDHDKQGSLRKRTREKVFHLVGHGNFRTHVDGA